jgi:hypothetical protein
VAAGVKAATSVLVAPHRLVAELSRNSSPGGYEGGLAPGWPRGVLGGGGDLQARGRPAGTWTRSRSTTSRPPRRLAYEFGRVADELGGWSKAADRYLQPGARVGRSFETIEAVRGYLMSKSSTPWVEEDLTS